MLDKIYIILIVGVTLGLLVWMLYAGKKVGFRHNTNNGVQIKSRQAIGRSEQIVVFSYRNQEYMVGVTSHGISLIDKSTAPLEPETEDRAV